MKDKARIIVTSLPINDGIRFLPELAQQAVEKELAEIQGRDIDLVLFPQYTAIEEEHNAGQAGIVQLLHHFAQKNRCYVVYNVLRKSGERQSCVSVITDRDGKVVGEYIKTHRIEGLDLDLLLGSETPVFELDFGKVALLAGTDLYFPEVAEIYSVKGAELLLCSLGPSILRDDTEIQRLLKGRSVADYVYVAASSYSSEETLYMASNVELYHGANREIDISGSLSESFNAFGLGKHTGRAIVYDMRGEIIAGTGRESGHAEGQLDLHRKRNLIQYNFGTGGILFHQNERGIFEALGRPYNQEQARQFVSKPVVSLVHIPYKDTFQNTAEDWYKPILEKIKLAAGRGSDLVVCSEYSRGDDGRPQTEGLDELLQGCSLISRDYGCYIAINEGIDGMNTSLLFGRDGAIIHKYVKVNPLNMMYQKMLPAGEVIEPVELDFGKVGFMICADSYCQEIPRVHALKGADMIILQTQSWGYDANAINEGVARAWAIENHMTILTNGFPTSQVTHRSNVIDPTGETVFASDYAKEDIYTVAIDLEVVRNRPSFKLVDSKVTRESDLRERLMQARRPELYAPLATGRL
ncbi:carbon-nitrogen hydrolase family protein [Paenibacillus solisilvae]|uniref:Carbon-nitrogen hydrolase family protein n=1 Tax=Paenibacillus solisilvae TaxID=2486751 RepID=A0ABW0W8B0_9BACL